MKWSMKKIVISVIACIAILATLVYWNGFFLHLISPSKNQVSSLEKTFAIIKPDAVKAKNSGKIIDLIEQHGFDIIRMQKITLDKNQAEEFYAIHKKRPFFKNLVTFMTSGPIIVMALQKDNAVKEWRDLMGETNPANAAQGTIRKLFGTDITHNASHGSDSLENAKMEIKQFFNDIF